MNRVEHHGRHVTRRARNVLGAVGEQSRWQTFDRTVRAIRASLESKEGDVARLSLFAHGDLLFLEIHNGAAAAVQRDHRELDERRTRAEDGRRLPIGCLRLQGRQRCDERGAEHEQARCSVHLLADAAFGSAKT